jgi:hypothetical protein
MKYMLLDLPEELVGSMEELDLQAAVPALLLHTHTHLYRVLDHRALVVRSNL